MSEAEHEAWARRLQALRPRLQGPIYFLWGTDWEDAPVVNAGRLQARLPPELAFDWHTFARGRASGGRRSIADLLSSPAPASKASTTGASPRHSACRSCVRSCSAPPFASRPEWMTVVASRTVAHDS